MNNINSGCGGGGVIDLTSDNIITIDLTLSDSDDNEYYMDINMPIDYSSVNTVENLTLNNDIPLDLSVKKRIRDDDVLDLRIHKRYKRNNDDDLTTALDLIPSTSAFGEFIYLFFYLFFFTCNFYFNRGKFNFTGSFKFYKCFNVG